MKRYDIERIEIPDWIIDWDEIRMGWYYVNAERITGNKIGIDGVGEQEGRERIVTDIINLELSLNRTSTYWNKLFVNLFQINKIPFSNGLKPDNTNEHFSNWSIEILENIYLTFDKEQFEIRLEDNKDLLFVKNWEEMNGTEFYRLIQKLNFRF